jgi:flagellar protein FlgJ
MRKTVNKTGMIHGGQAEEIFSDMLDQERAKSMSIGIGDMLFMQLSKSIVPTKKP